MTEINWELLNKITEQDDETISSILKSPNKNIWDKYTLFNQKELFETIYKENPLIFKETSLLNVEIANFLLYKKDANLFYDKFKQDIDSFIIRQDKETIKNLLYEKIKIDYGFFKKFSLKCLYENKIDIICSFPKNLIENTTTQDFFYDLVENSKITISDYSKILKNNFSYLTNEKSKILIEKLNISISSVTNKQLLTHFLNNEKNFLLLLNKTKEIAQTKKHSDSFWKNIIDIIPAQYFKKESTLEKLISLFLPLEQLNQEQKEIAKKTLNKSQHIIKEILKNNITSNWIELYEKETLLSYQPQDDFLILSNLKEPTANLIFENNKNNWKFIHFAINNNINYPIEMISKITLDDCNNITVQNKKILFSIFENNIYNYDHLKKNIKNSNFLKDILIDAIIEQIHRNPKKINQQFIDKHLSEHHSTIKILRQCYDYYLPFVKQELFNNLEFMCTLFDEISSGSINKKILKKLPEEINKFYLTNEKNPSESLRIKHSFYQLSTTIPEKNKLSKIKI